MSTIDQNSPVHSIHPNQVRDEALRLTSAGLSVIPITAGGSKDPAYWKLPTVWDEHEQKERRVWKLFQHRIASPEEVIEFFNFCMPGLIPGIGVICGRVSDGLEVIDVDDWETAQAFLKLIRVANPELLARLVLVQSPRPGLHLYYRCDESGRNRKLAEIPNPDEGGLKPKGIIEVKAEGGVCLAPGSPPNCHRTSQPYQYLQHHITQVPRITIAERNFLEDCARKFNRWNKPVQKILWPVNRPDRGPLGRPGDDYNLHATWKEILIPKGWRLVNSDRPVGYWCRPGKQDGYSATTNYGGHDQLFVFSSNASPFEPDRGYSKFAALAFLWFEGDFKAAARHAQSHLIKREASTQLTKEVSNQLRILRILKGSQKKT